MKYLLIAIMALGLVGCYEGDTKSYINSNNSTTSNSYWEYFNNDGILLTCTTSDSNNTTCSPYYDGNGELVFEDDEELSDEEISEIIIAGDCPIGYAWCSIEEQCNPVSSTGSVCTQ